MHLCLRTVICVFQGVKYLQFLQYFLPPIQRADSAELQKSIHTALLQLYVFWQNFTQAFITAASLTILF